MTYTDQLQRIANDYFATHDGEPTSKDIARWAIDTRRWEAPACTAGPPPAELTP